ncbi:MAG: hypothetical protein P1P87_03360 [Trueperaceae bacterium]|nr:hypothetical protein [Trueperaceae bacterium]
MSAAVPSAAATPDLAAVHDQLALVAEQLAALADEQRRTREQLEVVAAESRRAAQRWDEAEALLRDLTPMARRAVGAASEKLAPLEDPKYREVLGATAQVADRMLRSFEPAGVRSIGDNLVLLLKTIQGMR